MALIAMGNKRLGKVHHWGIPAGEEYCPGSLDDSGGFVPVCRICYARKHSFNRFPNVVASRERKAQEWKEVEWVDGMIREISRLKPLGDSSYFRWFDTGDIYTEDLGLKIMDVILGTPKVKHLIFTKVYDIPHLAPVVEELSTISNCCVRFSAKGLDGKYNEGFGNSAVVVNYRYQIPKGSYLCDSCMPGSNSTCSDCKICWEKDQKVVTFISH